MGKRRRVVNMTPGPTLDSLLAASPVKELNIRQHRADQASREVAAFIHTCARTHSGEVVSIVTGKGLRSEAGPVLEPMVRRLLEGELARFIAEFARDSGRGRFVVKLR